MLDVAEMINNYARDCRELYGDAGFVEECRYMRCHEMVSMNDDL